MNKMIEKHLGNLDWRRPKAEQNEAVRFLANGIGKEFPRLFLPAEHKERWQNAALVIAKIGRPQIDGFLFEMLHWLKDVNWPGADTIILLLREIERETIEPEILRAIETSMQENDSEWEYSLREFQNDLLST